MGRKVIGVVFFVVATCFGPAALFAGEPLPAELVIVRAQPAVFRVLVYGDYELRVPEYATLEDTLLFEAYRNENPSAAEGPSAERTKYCWTKLIENVGTYLKVSSQNVARSEVNQPMRTGTAFAISREGILLTNAHVVADDANQALTDDRGVLLQILGAEIDQWLKLTSEKLGGYPPDELMPTAIDVIMRWCAQNSRIDGKFREARLVLKFERDSSRDTLKLRDGKSFVDIINEAPQPVTAPLIVLAKGEPLPGKDVAVVKVDLVQELRQVFLASDPTHPESVEESLKEHQWDKLICLPLASWENVVLPGTRVQAMGFPGIGFDPQTMDPSAEYRVSAQDGQVSQTKKMLGGWQAIEMTADINHGDSGGPVINQKGEVIGLIVAVAEGPGHTLAVPIVEAEGLLDVLKIKPDPGPLSAKWEEGLRLLAAEKYPEALGAFEFVADVQQGARAIDGELDAFASVIKSGIGGVGPGITDKMNPYVKDMINRCNIMIFRQERKQGQ